MKREKPAKPVDHPALTHDLPLRLAELEKDLRRYGAEEGDDHPLKSISHVSNVIIGDEKVIQFSLAKKTYAAGHTDMTYAGSNHARGVRHIRFYEAGQVVLDIEGDFEAQQFGSNFQFKNIDLFRAGPWEADFIALTDRLRQHAAKRRLAFNKKRAAEHARRR